MLHDILYLYRNYLYMILENNTNDSIAQSALNNTIVQASNTITNSTNSSETSTTNLDNSLSYSFDSSLKTRAESIELAYSIASEGVVFSQYTSVALTQQYDILEDIKNKLTHITTNDTTDKEKEIFRKDITNSLEIFDKIAKDSNYNKLYYLQKSNTENSSSTVYNFVVSEFPKITIPTDSIQSNTTGLGLDTLKNLEEGELTNLASSTGLSVSKKALLTIEDFQDIYIKLQKTFQASVTNLNNVYTNLESIDTQIKEINYAQESANFSKADIFRQQGNFAVAQANTIQSMVSELLSY